MELFGARGARARRGALLFAAVLLSYRPKLPKVVLDEIEDED
jgi:hypothetical protein